MIIKHTEERPGVRKKLIIRSLVKITRFSWFKDQRLQKQYNVDSSTSEGYHLLTALKSREYTNKFRLFNFIKMSSYQIYTKNTQLIYVVNETAF